MYRQKSHNLVKRSWLTTIKTNEGTLLPCPFVVISLIYFICLFCILFIIAYHPHKDCKAQCKLQKERYKDLKQFSYHILLQSICASNSHYSYLQVKIRCTVCYYFCFFYGILSALSHIINIIMIYHSICKSML